jgi:hypothetical protein
MKKFYLSREQIEQIIPPDLGGCLITDRVTVDGHKIGYMYREVPARPDDSGWRFYAGDESQDYIDDLSLVGIYAVNTAANYDRDIVPYLHTPPPCEFEKIEGEHGYRKI